MLLPGGGVERVLGPHLQKVHRTNHTPAARPAVDRDVVTISVEARLVQEAREAAAKLPEVREELIDRVSARLSEGRGFDTAEVADAVINGIWERHIP